MRAHRELVKPVFGLGRKISFSTSLGGDLEDPHNLTVQDLAFNDSGSYLNKSRSYSQRKFVYDEVSSLNDTTPVSRDA